MIRLALRVSDEQAELVLAELLELAPGGVEEVREQPGTVEYALYGSPGELPSLPALEAVAGGALVQIATTEIPDDWHERWREFHKPVLIAAPRAEGAEAGACLRVRPPWEQLDASLAADGRAIEIAIDPGQAFGTGAHASTRLCLELLLELAQEDARRGPALDIGTGSGVLAIAARALGFAQVLALDNDRESVHAAHENALANGVEITVRQLDLRSQQLPWSFGDPRLEGPPGGPQLVFANLLRPLLLQLVHALPGAPDHLIASGLLTEEADELSAAFLEQLGLRERARREQGEWAALWLVRG